MEDRSYEESSEKNDNPSEKDVEDTPENASAEPLEPTDEAPCDRASAASASAEPAYSGDEHILIVSESDYAEMKPPAGESEPSHKAKRSHSVPLVAFVASLLAVLLVCGMFTYAIASATRQYGYLEGIAEIVGIGNGSSGGLYEDLFDSEGDFHSLEFLDDFFKTHSYYDLDETDFETAVLKAYVEASGDLYAEYYTPEEFEALNADNAGAGVGIGVSVVYAPVTIEGIEYTALQIITAFPGSPAFSAGVKPGDLVFYIGIGEEREMVQNVGYTEALNRLRGEKGTTAEFTVLRPQSDGTYEELEFTIIRDEYTMQSVEYKVSETDPTVGIVRILQFDLTTPTQFQEAMDALTKKGVRSFVFDVRNNPGGDLKSICAVLSYFLEEGDLIISAVDRSGEKEEHFAEVASYSGDYASCSIARSDIGKYRGYEMAVLTNGNTASAAELFTATLRDYELATIVGTTTYGKGSMQSIFPLAYWGYEGALKLTTRHYFPPCGEGYDGVGIPPDVEVELSEEAASVNIYLLKEADDDQLLAALAELGR